MNAARIAKLLRALADELEADADAPHSDEPRPKRAPPVDEIAKARARQNLQKRGLL